MVRGIVFKFLKVSIEMIKLLKYLIFLIAFTSISFSSIAKSDENVNFSFGQEIDLAKISNQDITIDDFRCTNLPEGNGTALKGEKNLS